MTQKLELSRRKALGAIASIGVGASAIGAGTFAAFSDTADSTDNELTSGTLDLQMGESGEGSFDLSASNMAPGDSDTVSVTLNNAGSLPGYLSVTINEITNDEGEKDTPNGRLTDALQIQLWLEPTNDGNGEVDGNATEAVLTASGDAESANNNDPGKVTADDYYDSEASPSSVTYDNVVELVADGEGEPSASQPTFESYDLVLSWELPSSQEGLDDIDDINAVMGDTATFDFTFEVDGSKNSDSTTTI